MVSYYDYRTRVLEALEANGYEPETYCEHDEDIREAYEDDEPVSELVKRILKHNQPLL